MYVCTCVYVCVCVYVCTCVRVCLLLLVHRNQVFTFRWWRNFSITERGYFNKYGANSYCNNIDTCKFYTSYYNKFDEYRIMNTDLLLWCSLLTWQQSPLKVCCVNILALLIVLFTLEPNFYSCFVVQKIQPEIINRCSNTA